MTANESQTLWGKIWYKFKHFPRILAKGSQSPPTVSGPAAAALISAGFSCFFLMVNEHAIVVFKAWEQIMKNIGRWVPGISQANPMYGDISSYVGLEIVILTSWFLSWFVLARFWQHRQVKSQTIFFWLFAFFVAATVMNWHPLFPYLPIIPN